MSATAEAWEPTVPDELYPAPDDAADRCERCGHPRSEHARAGYCDHDHGDSFCECRTFVEADR